MDTWNHEGLSVIVNDLCWTKVELLKEELKFDSNFLDTISSNKFSIINIAKPDLNDSLKYTISFRNASY